MLNAGSDTAAQDLGTAAAAGTSSSYSRADHVHKLPSAADVGAVATSQLGVVSGVATLDADGKLTTAQIPALTTSQIAQITPAGIGAMATSERAGLATLTAGSLTTSQALALTGDVTSTAGNPATTVVKIQSKAVSNATPGAGQVLTWDGAQWAPATSSGGGGGGANGLTYYFNEATAADAPTTNIPGTVHQLGRSGEAGQTVVTTGTLVQNTWTLIAGFVSETLPQDPAVTAIPAGLWDTNFWCYGDANVAAGTSVRAVAYIYSVAGGGTLTALGSPSSAQVINGTSAQYSLSVLVPQTAIFATDRIYIALEAYATGNNHTVTAQFGDSTPSHIHTSLPLVGGTGLWKSVAGQLQSPAALLFDADVDASAGIANSKIAGLAASATTDTTNASNITSGTLRTDQLATISGLPVGAQGSGTQVPVVTVDSKGRVTALSTTTITGGGTVTTSGTGLTGSLSKFSSETEITKAVAGTDYQAALTTAQPLALTSGGTGAIAPHDALFNLGSPTHQADCRTTSNIVPTTVVGTFTTAGWVNGATTITLTAGNTASLAIGMVLGTSGLLSSSILALPNSSTITLSSPATSTVSVSTNLVFYNTTATTMTIAATGVQVFDGQTVEVGDVVAFTNQSALSLMGPWVCTTAGAVGVQPVYARPSWFTGTSASPVLMHITKGLISIGQVYSIYPTVAAAVNVGFVALAASLVNQRGTTAVLGANAFSSTQTFMAGTTTVVPAKFSAASVVLTTPLANAIEWDNTSLYLTNSSSVRKTVAYTDSNITGTAANVSGTVAVANGGTGQTAYTNGQLLIGNTTGSTLAKATLTPGTGIAITNGAGAITVGLANTTTVSTAAPSGGADGDFWYQY